MRWLALAVVLAGCAAIAGDDEGDYNYEAPITPYTETTVLIYRNMLSGDWNSETIRVPVEPDARPQVCFQLPRKELLQCFYVAMHGDGAVLIQVKPENTVT